MLGGAGVLGVAGDGAAGVEGAAGDGVETAAKIPVVVSSLSRSASSSSSSPSPKSPELLLPFATPAAMYFGAPNTLPAASVVMAFVFGVVVSGTICSPIADFVECEELFSSISSVRWKFRQKRLTHNNDAGLGFRGASPPLGNDVAGNVTVEIAGG